MAGRPGGRAGPRAGADSRMSTDGSVVVTCGSCGTRLRARPTFEGRTAKCPKCGSMLRIELPAAAAAGSPPPHAQPHSLPMAVPAPRALADEADNEPSVSMFDPSDVSDPPAMPAVAPPAVASTSSPAGREAAASPPTSAAPAAATLASSPAAPPAAPAASMAPATSPAGAVAAPPGVVPPAAAPRFARAGSGAAGFVKALILTAAVAVIGAFAWYLMARFGGRAQWVVKFASLSLLIGVGTATAMIGGSGRRGAGVKLAAVLAAVGAIVMGKALVVLLLQLPQEAGGPPDPKQWGRLILSAFNAVDPLFFAMAVAGSAVRFILARP